MDWHEAVKLCISGPRPRLAILQERAPAIRIAETLVGLANAQGGDLLIFSSARIQDQIPLGLTDPDATLLKAMDAILLISPQMTIPLPQKLSDGENVAVWLSVPQGLHVYSVHAKYLAREGVHNVPISAYELRRLLIERGAISYDTLPVPHSTLDDIDWHRVQNYAQKLGLATTIAPHDVLVRRGCLDSETGRPTYAGILLFGRMPEKFVRSSEIVAVRYAGTNMGDRFVREDIRGTLPDQIQRAQAFVLDNMRRRTSLVGLERTEQPQYPEEVIREAIVNAVAHRDYSIGGDGIRLLMFADRLEVNSPGRLPGHITLDNIVDERFSRNEAIVQVLADLGHIERLGYGIDRMLALLHASGLPAPSLDETDNGFRISIWGHDQEPMSSPQRPWRHAGVNVRQERALVYLDEHDRITSHDYQLLCPEVSAETLRRDLADLVKRGVLLKIGQKRATYYVRR